MADFKCNVDPEVIVLSDSDDEGSNESTVSPAAADGLGKYAFRFTGCVDYTVSAEGLSFEEVQSSMLGAIERLGHIHILG